MPDLSPNPFCNKLPPVTKVPSARQSAASINTDAESARCLFRKQQKDITSTLANHLSCRLLSPNQIVMPGLPSEVTSTVDWLPIITSAPAQLPGVSLFGQNHRKLSRPAGRSRVLWQFFPDAWLVDSCG